MLHSLTKGIQLTRKVSSLRETITSIWETLVTFFCYLSDSQNTTTNADRLLVFRHRSAAAAEETEDGEGEDVQRHIVEALIKQGICVVR